jgi:hypothetical protein
MLLYAATAVPAAAQPGFRWWKDYSHRKNDEEDMVADSLLYDERCHLPRTTAGPRPQPEPEVTAAAAAAKQPQSQAAAGVDS